MEPFAKLTPTARRNLLAAILLVVLLALTAAAWVIAASVSPLRAGETWYLIRMDDRPVGWRVVQREAVPDGGSEGYGVRVLQGRTDTLVSWSRWQLGSDQRRGEYVSRLGALRRGRPLAELVTRIVYDAPQVALTNVKAGLRRTVEVGEDYIPEGRLRPTVVTVARTGETFQGTLALDAELAVVPVIIESEGPVQHRLDDRRVRLTAVRLTWPSEDVDATPRRYLVDDDGAIVVVQTLDGQGHITQTATRTSLDQVRRHYPRAHLRRNQLLDASQP
ncbi:MAG: hypothetical protein ACOC95_03605 [Planctomycetota bacterium]